jgi:hypothetical protein
MEAYAPEILDFARDFTQTCRLQIKSIAVNQEVAPIILEALGRRREVK